MRSQWSLELIEAPEILPVTVAEVKKRLRIQHNQEDDLIEGFIRSAVAFIDGATGFLGSCIVSQKWRFNHEGLLDKHCQFEIMLGNIKSIDQITMMKNGVETIVPVTDYELYKRNMLHAVRPVYGKSWPSHDLQESSIKIDFTAGEPVVTDADGHKSVKINWAIQQAINLMAVHYFNNRDDASSQQQHDITGGAKILLKSHRIIVI